jgi:hypothetical protein
MGGRLSKFQKLGKSVSNDWFNFGAGGAVGWVEDFPSFKNLESLARAGKSGQKNLVDSVGLGMFALLIDPTMHNK